MRMCVYLSQQWILFCALKTVSYTLESVVRGYHIYKTIWTPVIGQILEVQFVGVGKNNRQGGCGVQGALLQNNNEVM